MFSLLTPVLALAGWNHPCEQRAPLVTFIARREGWWHDGSLVRRTHNPGALRYAAQPGASPGPRGFAMFDSDLEGWEALERLIAHYRDAGHRWRRAWPYLRGKLQ